MMRLNNLKRLLNAPLVLFAFLVLSIVLSYLCPNIMRRGLFIGDIYLRLMELCIYPLILLSILRGSIGLPNRVFKRELKTFSYYWFGCAMVLTLVGVLLSLVIQVTTMKNGVVQEYTGIVEMRLSEIITNAVPNNFILAFISDNIMQVVFLAVLISYAINRIKNPGSKKFIMTFVNSLYDLLEAFISSVVVYLPVGVFFLISNMLLNNNIDIVQGIIKLILVLYLGYAFVLLIVYPLIIRFILKINCFSFLKQFYMPLILAITSCSSGAAFPLVLDKLDQENKRYSEAIGGFALILKHANCLQTPIYCIVVAKMVGLNITFLFVISACFFGMLSSIGTAGIPGGGIVMIAAVFKMLGLPLEYVSMIAGIYVIIDIPGTTINVLDDCIGLSLIKQDYDGKFATKVNSADKCDAH